ncbi:MAG: hypothetical protein L0219_15140 [Phycisphaerales bacterium]|nr:hypothetical protein [Phycisphaerales bacterium]
MNLNKVYESQKEKYEKLLHPARCSAPCDCARPTVFLPPLSRIDHEEFDIRFRRRIAAGRIAVVFGFNRWVRLKEQEL